MHPRRTQRRRRAARAFVLADATYRRAIHEHAAASLPNVLQAVTQLDEPEPAHHEMALRPLLIRVAGSVAVLAALGFVIAHAGSSIAEGTGL